MKGLLLGSIAAVVVLGGGGLALGGAVFAGTAGAAVDEALFRVRRGDLPIALTESGSLVAQKSEKLEPEFDGPAVISFLVPEGDEVEAGTVVCRFDTKEAQKALDDLELQLLTAQTTLSAATTDLEIQEVDNVTAIEKARIADDKARNELERYRDGDAPQEKRKLQIALKDAQTVHAKAKKKYEDSLRLIELKYINQSELDDHAIAFEKAQVQKEEAELAIELFDKYVFPMTLAEKENAVVEQKRGLQTAEKRARSELEKKKVAVEQARKRVDMLERSIADAKESLAKMELKAPARGIVVYGDPRRSWYRENVKVGGQVHRGFTVLTIPVLSVMQVKLDVHEADINKITAGLPARITMDTYPGLVLDGEVTKVASIAGSSRPWDSEGDVKKFEVEVTIRKDESVELKPGISAKVEIMVDVRKDALHVPLQCAFLEDGAHYVNVATPAGPQRRKVEVGLANDHYVEILAGLAPGEPALLYNPGLPPPAGKEPAAPDAAAEEAPAAQANGQRAQ
jgi:HlyD family secretion protein